MCYQVGGYKYEYPPTVVPDSITLGDCFKIMPGIQTGAADMVWLDPPYFIRADEWDNFASMAAYMDFMGKTFWEAERMLKENGTLAFWHNDLRKIAKLMEWLETNTTFRFNSWVLWEKPNFRKKVWGAPGQGNTLRSWFNIGEFCLFYVKGRTSTDWNKTGLSLAHLDMGKFGPLRDYFRQMQEQIGKTKAEIKAACGQAADHCFRWNSTQWLLPTRETYLEIVATYGLESWPGYRTFDSLEAEQQALLDEYAEEISAANAARFTHNLDPEHCNIWVTKEPPTVRTLHKCQKPVDLYARGLRVHTNPGDLVVDPMAGSGALGVAAIQTGRHYMLIEQEARHYNAAAAWLKKAAQQ